MKKILPAVFLFSANNRKGAGHIKINKAGCPVFDNADELQSLIDRYFDNCQGRPALDKNGEQMRDKNLRLVFDGCHPPTVSGLALALGFADKQSFLSYKSKPQLDRLISRAKTRIESLHEQQLFENGGFQGAKLCLLSNFPGYIGSSSDGGEDPVSLLLKGLDDD